MAPWNPKHKAGKILKEALHGTWILEFRMGLLIDMHQHMLGSSHEEFLGQSWTTLPAGVALWLCWLVRVSSKW